MITSTSLKHPTTRRKILKASQNVLKGWSVDHVRDNQGNAYMAIRYDEVTKRFIVFDRDYNVITDVVANSF